MDYATFKAAAFMLERRESALSEGLAMTRRQIADRLGIEPDGPMGLTPDAIKASPDYQNALALYREAFATLRAFNGQYAKRFRREIAADIQASREARLIA